MKIAVVYNKKTDTVVKKKKQNPEKVDKETLNAVKKAISKKHDVCIMDFDRNFIDNLRRLNIDMVFNLSYGIQGNCRQSQVPAMLEMAGIPYTGSDVLGHAIAIDKPVTKMLLKKAGLQTPKFQVMSSKNQKLSKRLSYPLVVKPSCGSLHKGIKVVQKEEELRSWVDYVVRTYNQDALVEEYAACEEYTVCVLGNEKPVTLPILHIKPNTRCKYPILVKGVKNKKICPALLDKKYEERIRHAAIKAHKVTQMKDFSRIDLKLMDDGSVCILEVNSSPGIHPIKSFLPQIASVAGISFDGLINMIVDFAIQRYDIIGEASG